MKVRTRSAQDQSAADGGGGTGGPAVGEGAVVGSVVAALGRTEQVASCDEVEYDD